MSILTLAAAIFKYMNHRTFRSRCCGATAEMGIDVDSPKRDEVKPVDVIPV